jgi:hypothetical protein
VTYVVIRWFESLLQFGSMMGVLIFVALTYGFARLGIFLLALGERREHALRSVAQ